MTAPWNPVHTAPTASVVEVTVDGHAHRVAIPAEWSGSLNITVNVHRGAASKKIMIGRSQAVMVEERKEG